MNIETDNLKLIEYREVRQGQGRLVVVKCSTITNPNDIRDYYRIDDMSCDLKEALQQAMDYGSDLSELKKLVVSW